MWAAGGGPGRARGRRGRPSTPGAVPPGPDGRPGDVGGTKATAHSVRTRGHSPRREGVRRRFRSRPGHIPTPPHPRPDLRSALPAGEGTRRLPFWGFGSPSVGARAPATHTKLFANRFGGSALEWLRRLRRDHEHHCAPSFGRRHDLRKTGGGCAGQADHGVPPRRTNPLRETNPPRGSNPRCRTNPPRRTNPLRQTNPPRGTNPLRRTNPLLATTARRSGQTGRPNESGRQPADQDCLPPWFYPLQTTNYKLPITSPTRSATPPPAAGRRSVWRSRRTPG